MPKHTFIFGFGLAKLVACQDLMILNQLHIQRSFLQILDTVNPVTRVSGLSGGRVDLIL